MPYEPQNRKKFFEGLGPDGVRDGIISGEITGALADAGNVWLTHCTQAKSSGNSRLSLILSVVAIAVTICVGIYQVNPTQTVEFFRTTIFVNLTQVSHSHQCGAPPVGKALVQPAR